MDSLVSRLLGDTALHDHPLLDPIGRVMSYPTGVSSAGFPYLTREAWTCFRDTVPHLFAQGLQVLAVLDALSVEAKARVDLSDEERTHLAQAQKVIKQVVLTASVTAPPTLWLLRQVLSAFQALGLSAALESGGAVDPSISTAKLNGQQIALDAEELDIDLRFALSLGLVEAYEDAYRIAGHPRAAALLRGEGLIPRARDYVHHTAAWRAALSGQPLTDPDRDELRAALQLSARTDGAQNHWLPTPGETEIGFRLVPLVLALRAHELTADLVREGAGLGETFAKLAQGDAEIASAARHILSVAGWITEGDGGDHLVTPVGARGFLKGPGPFGIIETYHPYMEHAQAILLGKRDEVWVRRGENVGASQDANRATFKQANDALDRFCLQTGFTFDVFIEHAIGRGEATRQRFEREAGRPVHYFGADLEDAAIDAAIEEQEAGHLPDGMKFIRHADIGSPEILIGALHDAGVPTQGAVMVVGNGFHEVRGQTDERMIEVFRGYHDAGIVLIFTEESALSIDDLRATAFNTYHAGFKYVHEKSGQGLRPAFPPQSPPRLGRPMRAAWSECAAAAGYVRLDAFSHRTRTIYPYPPSSGQNPSISVNHFFVPAPIAAHLRLASDHT